MESKYYKPEITEFHVGFEYERITLGYNDEWHKEVIYAEFNEGWESNMDYVLATYEDGCDDYRVKYLDKEDIEKELGIIPKNGGSYFFEKESCFRPNWISGVYVMKTRIMFHPSNTWIEIDYFIEGEWEKFFEGSVKNISEFRKLLKQVGYE